MIRNGPDTTGLPSWSQDKTGVGFPRAEHDRFRESPGSLVSSAGLDKVLLVKIGEARRRFKESSLSVFSEKNIKNQSKWLKIYKRWLTCHYKINSDADRPKPIYSSTDEDTCVVFLHILHFQIILMRLHSCPSVVYCFTILKIDQLDF